MTPEQVNVAMAELEGWRFPGHPDVEDITSLWTSHGRWCLSPDGNTYFIHQTPNYYSDLNAVARVATKLSESEQGIHNVKLSKAAVDGMNLRSVIQEPAWIFRFTNATAPQRCEAILRTLGKWKN